ncbi:unnamed protein product [Callosobruchus maculatus]|uniref:Uncharacterized protein n=1 Tax=Callosobruchus maculatus TaxID=64391 RepID=A0A653DLV4_CALMS|nr:unnamed protein product [Callosobruchus maculatus]
MCRTVQKRQGRVRRRASRRVPPPPRPASRGRRLGSAARRRFSIHILRAGSCSPAASLPPFSRLPRRRDAFPPRVSADAEDRATRVHSDWFPVGSSFFSLDSADDCILRLKLFGNFDDIMIQH